MMDWKSVEKDLIFFIRDELKKTSLKSIVLGLSGGLDSAIVAVLTKKALKDTPYKLYTLILPTNSSSKKHLKDAKKLCKKFKIKYDIYNIEKLVKLYFKDEHASKLRIGNFASRIRMSILYDVCAKKNAVVIGTSNKSELSLGYGTLHGDLAYAFNPIGNIYKSDLFEFAKYLKINKQIIKKAPSADFWEGQKDEDELGYSYAKIDMVLKDFLDNHEDRNELLKKGYDEKLIDMIIKRYFANRFKTELPNIAKI